MHLGLLTVLEWPKDDSEPEGADRPAFQRDTTRTYLVTTHEICSPYAAAIARTNPNPNPNPTPLPTPTQVTSRDGLSVDLQHLYAHQPILPTGERQGDWNAGFKLPAAQIVSRPTSGT